MKHEKIVKKFFDRWNAYDVDDGNAVSEGMWVYFHADHSAIPIFD